MPVTVEDVAHVIRSIFTCKPQVNEEWVGFGLVNEFYNTEVHLMLETDSSSKSQILNVNMWFCAEDERRMVIELDYHDALELCDRIEDRIMWGNVFPSEADEGFGYEIVLNRVIDTSALDLKLALEGQPESELLRTLQRLSDEWLKLSPVIGGIAVGQLTELDHIELFLDQSASST